MNGAGAELVVRPTRALRRSAAWWAAGTVAFAVLNAAFWPSLRDGDVLEGLDDGGAFLEAFGARDLASPAGYLDGQVFALMLPLILAAMALTHASLLTAGDEDAGRLELLLALPVARRSVWLARWTASLATLAAVTAVVAVAMLACLPAFSFDGVGAGRVLAATLACGLLAAFHGAVAYVAAAVGWSRGRAVGVAVTVLVAGYLAALVLPLAEALRGARAWSPWYWALGEQPVLAGVSAPRLALLVAVTAALVAAGTLAVGRRDMRSA